MTETTTRRLTDDSDLDDVAALLDELGLDYTRHDRHTDREVIGVPGYGDIWYDSRVQLGEEFGLVVDLPDGTADPVEADDLERELREVGEMAADLDLSPDPLSGRGRMRRPGRVPPWLTVEQVLQQLADDVGMEEVAVVLDSMTTNPVPAANDLRVVQALRHAEQWLRSEAKRMRRWGSTRSTAEIDALADELAAAQERIS